MRNNGAVVNRLVHSELKGIQTDVLKRLDQSEQGFRLQFWTLDLSNS